MTGSPSTPRSAPSPAQAGEGWGEGGAGAKGEGSCFCGAIRYRFALPPLWIAHCHCTMCRRAQGAAFVTWVGVAGEKFELLGDDPGRLRSHRSSPDATRSFCGRCGTPLFFESARWPGELHLTLASVEPEAAAKLAPQAHVHWADRVTWIGDIDDSLPRHEATGSS